MHACMHGLQRLRNVPHGRAMLPSNNMLGAKPGKHVHDSDDAMYVLGVESLLGIIEELYKKNFIR